MKQITFQKIEKTEKKRDFNYLYAVFGFLITVYFSFLMGISYGTPVTPSYNGYIMNFRGEKIKVVEDVKAEEPKEPTLDEYVTLKFGHEAWKAFAILHGTKYCGGENGSHNPEAFNVNNDPEKTEDWGFWQFNEKWHPEVSRECAKSVVCSTDRAYEVSKKGTNFSAWTAGKCIGV